MLPILKSMYPSPPDTISIESFESGDEEEVEGPAANESPPWPEKKWFHEKLLVTECTADSPNTQLIFGSIAD